MGNVSRTIMYVGVRLLTVMQLSGMKLDTAFMDSRVRL